MTLIIKLISRAVTVGDARAGPEKRMQRLCRQHHLGYTLTRVLSVVDSRADISGFVADGNFAIHQAHCRTETQLVLDGIMATLILSTATLMRITVASGSALTIGNTNGAGGEGEFLFMYEARKCRSLARSTRPHPSEPCGKRSCNVVLLYGLETGKCQCYLY